MTTVWANRTCPDLHLFRNYPSPHVIASVEDYSHPENLQIVDIDKDDPDEITQDEFKETIDPKCSYHELKVCSYHSIKMLLDPYLGNMFYCLSNQKGRLF